MPFFHKVFFERNKEGVRIVGTNIVILKEDVEKADYKRLEHYIELADKPLFVMNGELMPEEELEKIDLIDASYYDFYEEEDE